MSRQDQSLVTVVVGGRPLGVWDKKTGGEVDSEESKYRPGGMGDQQALGGNSTTGNVTVERLYERERDHELCRWLMTQAGRAPMTVSDQPLDVDGNPFGNPLVYSGILKAVTPPDKDSESSDPATWSLECSTAGPVG